MQKIKKGIKRIKIRGIIFIALFFLIYACSKKEEQGIITYEVYSTEDAEVVLNSEDSLAEIHCSFTLPAGEVRTHEFNATDIDHGYVRISGYSKYKEAAMYLDGILIKKERGYQKGTLLLNVDL